MEGGGVKWSNFHITVNANAAKKNYGASIRELREACEYMVHNPELWTWLKQYKHGQQVEFKGAQKMLVERVRMRAAIEQEGQTNHSPHVHIVLEVAHRTMVQIDKSELKDLFEHFCGEGVNVHFRFIPGKGDDMEYIFKYITKEVPQQPAARRANENIRQAFLEGEIIADVKNVRPV